MGSAKESLGNLVGNENLRQAGIEQNQQGKEEEARQQVKDWGHGIAERSQGAVGSVKHAVTGDRAKEDEYRAMHDAGEAKQKATEEEIQRRG